MPEQINNNIASTEDAIIEYLYHLVQGYGTVKEYTDELEHYVNILKVQFNHNVDDFDLWSIFMDGVSTEGHEAINASGAHNYI
jgi:predicted oxidoreductase (fatty acid repression mutant protein)